jgi:hypothetical protein
LSAYDAGETPRGELIAIENHLLWCAGCRMLLNNPESLGRLFGRWQENNERILTGEAETTLLFATCADVGEA